MKAVLIGGDYETVVTFLQNERQGSVQSGNAVSGFWGGIALGRLLLPAFNVWVGERRVIFPYTAAAIALELWILLHRDLVSNGESRLQVLFPAPLTLYILQPLRSVLLALSSGCVQSHVSLHLTCDIELISSASVHFQPFFPIAISVISKLLPRHLHVGAIGFIAAIGSCGAAALPFATGALAQRYGEHLSKHASTV